jgi:hypothetical protein
MPRERLRVVDPRQSLNKVISVSTEMLEHIQHRAAVGERPEDTLRRQLGMPARVLEPFKPKA